MSWGGIRTYIPAKVGTKLRRLLPFPGERETETLLSEQLGRVTERNVIMMTLILLLLVGPPTLA